MERACTNVKEARDLPLHLSCVTRLTHGIACFKQVQLNLRGQIVSVHDYYRVDATQHMLLLLSRAGVRLAVALRLRPWNSTRAFPSGKGSAGALFWTSWRFISHARNMAQLCLGRRASAWVQRTSGSDLSQKHESNARLF